MPQNKNDIIWIWISLFAAVLAIVAIKSIFENDNSKIVSKKGKRLLSDEEKMNEISKKIHQSETAKSHSEIYI